MPLDLPQYRQQLAKLAEQGVFIGTSAWKYPGWCRLVYDEQHYLTRNKFSEAKFNLLCLAEYAKTYRTVCVDAGYYKFPSDAHIHRWMTRRPRSSRSAALRLPERSGGSRKAALFPQNTNPTTKHPNPIKNSHGEWIKNRGQAIIANELGQPSPSPSAAPVATSAVAEIEVQNATKVNML